MVLYIDTGYRKVPNFKQSWSNESYSYCRTLLCCSVSEVRKISMQNRLNYAHLYTHTFYGKYAKNLKCTRIFMSSNCKLRFLIALYFHQYKFVKEQQQQAEQ